MLRSHLSRSPLQPHKSRNLINQIQHTILQSPNHTVTITCKKHRSIKLCMLIKIWHCYQFSSVAQLWPFVTPWTVAHQASLSITSSQSLLKLMSIQSMMPSNHLILCRPLLLPSIFHSIRVFSNESILSIRWPKYWSFSFSISPSMNIQD